MTKEQRLARLIRQYESCRITKAELRRLLEKRVIGHVTGIVGPFVLRYHYGKLIISERALLYRESMSEEAVEGRSNFGAGVKFAKFLNEIPIIKEVWQNAPIAGRCSWNRLIKYNKINGMCHHAKTLSHLKDIKLHMEIPVQWERTSPSLLIKKINLMKIMVL